MAILRKTATSARGAGELMGRTADSGTTIHLRLEPAAASELRNDGCQVVWVDGLWHVDLKPSQ
jgi:hypothetical protein